MYLLTVTFYYDQSMIINSCGLRRICSSVYGKSVARGAFPPFFRFNAPKRICTYVQDLATSHKYCKYLQFFFDASITVPYVRISMFRCPKHTIRVIVCQNTRNHGGRRHTMAAMVPHSRLRCAETLANRLRNNAT